MYLWSRGEGEHRAEGKNSFEVQYLWSRGEVEHRAEGKNSFEVQSGFWTITRTVVDKVMGCKGSRVKEGGGCAVALVKGRKENKPVKLFLIICYVGVVWLKI